MPWKECCLYHSITKHTLFEDVYVIFFLSLDICRIKLLDNMSELKGYGKSDWNSDEGILCKKIRVIRVREMLRDRTKCHSTWDQSKKFLVQVSGTFAKLSSALTRITQSVRNSCMYIKVFNAYNVNKGSNQNIAIVSLFWQNRTSWMYKTLKTSHNVERERDSSITPTTTHESMVLLSCIWCGKNRPHHYVWSLSKMYLQPTVRDKIAELGIPIIGTHIRILAIVLDVHDNCILILHSCDEICFCYKIN